MSDQVDDDQCVGPFLRWMHSRFSWSTHSPASAISSMSRTVSLTTAGSPVNVIDSPETVGGLAQVIAFVGIGVHGDGWSLSKETESIHLPVPREKPMQATGISRGVISAVRERAYGRDQKPQLRGAYCCSGVGSKKKQPGDCSTFRRCLTPLPVHPWSTARGTA